DFHITESEDEIGFFCGLIASSFFFAQFCTSIFWGFMSDRYGRRPILLIGLCGTAIACTSFGLSKSLPWAIISRSMCGLLNGNVGVAKSMLGEIADKSNQSQAFGVFGFAWGIGMIVGPVLGGYLADPAKNFPEIFGELQFFIEYPYFLPCFVAAIGSLIGFIIGYFFLEETNRRAKTHTHDLMQNNASCPVNFHNDSERPDAYNDEAETLHSAKSTGIPAFTLRSGPPMNVDLERQPLMAHPNDSQFNQVKFMNQGMGRSIRYGSMMTLAQDDGGHHIPLYIPNTLSVSARSTLSRRSGFVRPDVLWHQRGGSVSGALGVSNSYFELPSSAGKHQFYGSRPMSLGSLFSLADSSASRSPRASDEPMNVAPIRCCDQDGNPYQNISRGMEALGSGRVSRLSAAPSQMYVLTSDPQDKDTQQPMQVVVIQSGTGLPPVSITTIIAYAMLALHSIVFEEVYTLFAVTPLRSHGLGWSAIQLSGSLASMGLAQLVLQFIIYPQFERRFSAVSIFQFGQLIYGCAYIVFPLIRAFAVDENDGPTAGQTPRVRYLILVALTIKYTCSVFSYTSVMVMVTNSSPAYLLGTVNGIGQTSASLMRAFGPALGGVLWAWSLSNKLDFPFNYFFVFFLMATIAILGFFHSLSIPRELGRK
ncbi:hypothetical protein BX616_002840, partial [Lobosporangium transversale]